MPKPWMSTFDGGELVLAEKLGIRPLGQVYGCSVQMISAQYFPAVTGEIAIEVEVFEEMLQRSLSHLRDEAIRLGANAVLGCRINWKAVDYEIEVAQPNYGSSMMVTGTAVHDSSVPPGNGLYLATAEIADVYALRKADFLPAGLAIGKCSYYQVAWRQVPTMTTGLISTWANEEIAELTQGPYAAREIAMVRMSDMAKSVGAVGIVGVQVATEVYPAGSMQMGTMAATCRFLCVGTAIRRNPGKTEEVSIGAAIAIN